jgi:shikimate dehydrogenase
LKIDARTRLCAVIGNPVHHSLSPAIHNAAFEAGRLNFAYLAFCVEDVGDAIRGMRALGLVGLSVTIPHKLAVIGHLDGLDPVAERVGSVNTVVNREGSLVGYTTDGLGALEALRDAGIDPRAQRVLIVGAGGSARAIAMTMAIESPPRHTAIAARDGAKAAALADGIRATVPGIDVAAVGLSPSELRDSLERATIVLQTTSVGMAPDIERCLIPRDWIRPDHVVFDIVYTPRVTELGRRAMAVGARVIPGSEMFVRQAAAQFRLWTGREAPIQVMRDVIDRGIAP